ncbi:MAG: right-handed parallel beta-helix repeat-containing protein, partial [Oscillospiraceae bacterium]|nr:right-handed parallel beta-helix repeat-containing protein [Oscillospiraceae bacterium]
MKKRITSLFLVLCMLLSMTMTVSFATGEETEPVTYPEQCCDGTHAEGTWLPLFATMNALKEERAALNADHGARYILPSGNYYMEKSMTFGSTIYIMGDVNICLNGQTLTTGLTGANGQFMTYSAALDGVEAVTGTLNLTVCDCSAEKTGTINATATTGTANAIRVYKGPSAVTIQGGTFSNFMGSGIEVADTTAGTSLTIEGGTITGNGRAQADNGGGVYTKMPFTMTGGIISNNYAKETGGGIYIGGNTATISGGTIKGNTTGGTSSGHGGGGVYVINKGAVLNMTGGEIIDNTGYRGGGVYAYYWGIFNMSGGTISGNSVTNSTHKSAVYLSGLRNVAEFSSGKIIDNNCPGVCVVGKSSADFSGVEITGNTSTQLNIAGLTNNTDSETPASMVHYVNVSDGTIGAISTAPGSSAYANLNVTGGKVGTITAGGSGTNTFSISGGRFAEEPEADYVVDGQVAGKDNADADYPWTIGDPYTVTVTPVSEGGTVTVDPATSIAGATVTVTVAPEAGYALDTLTVDGTDIKEAKSFVMVADADRNVVTATFVATSTVMTAEALLATAENGTVTLSDDVCLTDTLAVSDTLTLDLNGYTLTGTTFPYINVPDGAELTIQDSGENGAISGVEGVASGNALIHVAGKVTLEDGKIVDHTLNASGKRGVAVRLMLETDQTTTPEFVMNGGEISGHSTGSTNSRGAIGMYSGTKFTMDGGTISGNTATYGGAFATASSTVAKTITINGGVITGNTATLGGSVMFVDNTDVLITGGNIYGNINSAPTQDSYASALFINCPVVENVGRLGSFTMTGGTIGADTEGTTKNAIYVQRTDANISGSAVIGGAGLRAVNDSNVSGHKAYAKIIGLDSTASVLVNEGTAVVTDAKCEAYSETQNKYTYCGHASGLAYVEAKDATCTEAGNIEYWTCADCGNYFSDSEGQTPIIEVEIPAEHTYGELIEAQEAVHTQTELKGAVAAHYFCDVCDTYFDADKVETTLEDLTDDAPVHTPDIPAPTEEQAQHCTVCGLELAPRLEHTCTLTHVPANGATCTEAGNIEYWTCTCGKWYSDAEGNSEITDKTTVVIPAEH